MRKLNAAVLLLLFLFALACVLLFTVGTSSAQQQPPQLSDADLKVQSLQGQLATLQAEAQLTIRKLQKEITDLKAAKPECKD